MNRNDILCAMALWIAGWETVARCQEPALRHLPTNAFHMEHAQPAKYLGAGRQTTLTDYEWAEVRSVLQLTNINRAALRRLYEWKKAAFQDVRGGGKFVGRHTVQDLLRTKTLTGCHDHGLLVAAVLRRGGVPAIYVDATGIEWAMQYPDKTKTFQGHVFVEAWLEGRWMLLDSTSGEYVAEYDPLNPIIPIRKPGESKGFYVMFKGLDPLDYGVTDLRILTREQERYARMIKTEISKFQFPSYTIQSLLTKSD